jgi:tetratricopeptide (TPR) repeat protein
MRSRGIYLTLAALLAIATPALAEESLTPAENEQQYAACMALVSQDPASALESAVAWEREGGGDGALHCQARALIGLSRYEDGALLLQRIAEAMPQVKAPIAAEVFAQSGYAWLLAGKEELALHAFNEGLKLAPQSVDLLVDRANLYGQTGMFFEALDDLNAAIDLAPSRPDIYVFRASVYIDMEELDLAADNLDKAIDLAPNFPEALLQRGRLRSTRGDAVNARADLLRVLEMAPGTAFAEAAQRQLEILDIKVE